MNGCKGIDMQRAEVYGQIDGKGDAKIQVFLKTGPANRAPAFVAKNISINDPAASASAGVFDRFVPRASGRGLQASRRPRRTAARNSKSRSSSTTARSSTWTSP